jgi:hypothetical protein
MGIPFNPTEAIIIEIMQGTYSSITLKSLKSPCPTGKLKIVPNIRK